MKFYLNVKIRLILLNFSRFVVKTFLISNIIFLFLTFNQTLSIATESENVDGKYQPRPGRKRTQARKPGGYRGDICDFDSEVPLTLIVPKNHIPLTISTHPVFLWYVNAADYPIRFTIYEPGQPTPLYTQELLVDTPSIIALKLPKNTRPLEIGKQYRWIVSIICNDKRPSENIYAKAWIERVEDLQTRGLEPRCLNNYAREGIWHDALSCNNSLDGNFWSLIEQVKLSQIVNEKPQVIYLSDD